MEKPREEDFLDIKSDLYDPASYISINGVSSALLAFFFGSAVFIGIATFVALEETAVGWSNLSVFWRFIFLSQIGLFPIQLILVFFVQGKDDATQLIMNIAHLFFLAKLPIDIFITVLMFAKDGDLYIIFGPVVLLAILFGLFFHVQTIRHKIKMRVQDRTGKTQVKKQRVFTMLGLFPITFPLASIGGMIVKENWLGDYDTHFILLVASFIYFAIMYAIAEYFLAVYCLIRFPSFRVSYVRKEEKMNEK